MQLAETKHRPARLIAKKPRCDEMLDSGSFRSNTADELRCMAMRRCDITARAQTGPQVDGIKGSRGPGEARSGDQSSSRDRSGRNAGGALHVTLDTRNRFGLHWGTG